MLTNEDIKKLIEAQEEVFATKEDLEGMKAELREDFSDLQSAVDEYAKKADTYFHPSDYLTENSGFIWDYRYPLK